MVTHRMDDVDFHLKKDHIFLFLLWIMIAGWVLWTAQADGLIESVDDLPSWLNRSQLLFTLAERIEL